MVTFTDTYQRVRNVLLAGGYAPDWQPFVAGVLAPHLGVSGPSGGLGVALDFLRQRIKSLENTGVVESFMGRGVDSVLIDAASSDRFDSKIGEKAAALKVLKHLYFEAQTGGQQVWVYSPPSLFGRSIFDEVTGDDGVSRFNLENEFEIYNAGQRRLMSEALLRVGAWCQKVQINLSREEGGPIMRRWFLDDQATAADAVTAAERLRAGFKKVETLARSSQVIFAHDPSQRWTKGWKDWGFIDTRDSLHVIYIQEAYLKASASGEKVNCAIAITHELSHRVAETVDHRYQDTGVRPDEGFRYGEAINNAENWGFFAADMAGELSEADRLRGLY